MASWTSEAIESSAGYLPLRQATTPLADSVREERIRRSSKNGGKETEESRSDRTVDWASAENDQTTSSDLYACFRVRWGSGRSKTRRTSNLMSKSPVAAMTFPMQEAATEERLRALRWADAESSRDKQTQMNCSKFSAVVSVESSA